MGTFGILPKEFSWKLLIKIVIIVFIGAVVCLAFLYVSSEIIIGGNYWQSLQTLVKAKDRILRNSIIIYILTGTFILIGLALLTLFYSHRIAGPIYRLGKEAKTIAQGDLTVKIRLRKHDAVHSLADTMNELTDAYRERIIELNERLKVLKEIAERIEEGPSESPSLQDNIDRLSKEVRELQQKLKELRL